MNIYKINQIYKIAFNLLEENKLNRVPVDSLTLAKRLNVVLFTYKTLNKDVLDFMLENETNKDAFSFYEKETKLFYLFYDDELTQTRLRFVIARELAKLIFKDSKNITLEEALTYFPVLLLIPMYSLFFLPELDVNTITSNYDVSKENANLIISLFKKRLKKYGNMMFKYEEESFEIFKL